MIPYEFKFPDMLDDLMKVRLLNGYYSKIRADYVIVADADEFIFCREAKVSVADYLASKQADVFFARLWNVYRHTSEADLDPAIPVRLQRRHGVSALEGQVMNYIKPSIARGGMDFVWGIGHHRAILNNKPVQDGPLIDGAHWSMADSCFAVDRRVKGSRYRQSANNLSMGYQIQNHAITAEQVLEECRRHENDPLVI